ncbi:MAG: MFS transporter [Gammaproteobacteria bacterium]|nr:MFS transporter [Gammaproteobacteria bacterium]
MTVTLSNFQRRLLAFTMYFSLPLTGVGVDIYVPSLPHIAKYFQAPSSWVQLSLTIYMLAYGVGQLFIGPLSDCYGRKRSLIIGGVLFAIFSILAGLATNIYVLLLMRVLQGFCCWCYGGKCACYCH